MPSLLNYGTFQGSIQGPRAALDTYIHVFCSAFLTSSTLQYSAWTACRDKHPRALAIASPSQASLTAKAMSAAPATNEPQSAFEFPAEVLHAVFAQAWEPSSTDIDLIEKNSLRSTVLSCAQVCQHWRIAARDLSSGWSYAIDYGKNSPEVVADFLNLSRPHLLDVGHRSAPFRIRTKKDVTVLGLLKQEVARIREWNAEVIPIPGQSISSASWILPPQQSAVVALRVWGGLSLFAVGYEEALRNPSHPLNSSVTISIPFTCDNEV